LVFICLATIRLPVHRKARSLRLQYRGDNFLFGHANQPQAAMAAVTSGKTIVTTGRKAVTSATIRDR
jgi:hypothetical protein